MDERWGRRHVGFVHDTGRASGRISSLEGCRGNATRRGRDAPAKASRTATTMNPVESPPDGGGGAELCPRAGSRWIPPPCQSGAGADLGRRGCRSDESREVAGKPSCIFPLSPALKFRLHTVPTVRSMASDTFSKLGLASEKKHAPAFFSNRTKRGLRSAQSASLTGRRHARHG